MYAINSGVVTFLILFVTIIPTTSLTIDRISRYRRNPADQQQSRVVVNSQNVQNVFSYPTNCTKNGQIYQKGDEWTTGHLRYRCGQFGLYDIIGCITEKARPLQIGEDYVIDNVAHRCFRRDSSVYYRQFICGVFGQPPCDKLDSVTNETTTIKTNSGNLGGLPAIAGLPDGWKIVDAQGNPVHVSNIHVVSSSIGTPMAGANRNQRKRRHVRFLRAATTTERTTVDGERVVGVGTGTGDLNARTRTQTTEVEYKPGTVGGTRSDVQWHGKTVNIGGRQVAVGPGTFTVGSSPTGAFMRPN